MKVSITGRKVNLRDNFKELATKKLSRFDRIFDEDAQANVVVTVERNRQTVEITIKSGSRIYRAEETDFEMNDALDKVISALGRQIRKNKTRLEKEIHSAALDQYVQDYLHTEEEPDEYKIVRTKHFFVKPLSIEEAILQMNLLDHQFFMFRNETTGEINVVYKRKDGNYGLLEPDVE
ncbi:ribosome-associated translation inhibitor RaiA [Caproiciproducens galactitolivorans]|uniref:Ribosome hibernation promoting factor n=1 Tax=Caproiciproducens galactitolivorans TaxID=642589 RepID=A0A4Z0Y2E1_9FIRM|nr:ribosome-associated translation inhibitor RaiA [Caproiciproducens galactitolivorans]QEY34148.1 ribosome-associated translation inhibitor RaiA [Caproiciproducens galactitolivorans]TGJ78099.1 putative sigma-54 modulation protein [Caproiciproducens galactitolivorans]